jgi:hypothetical protein
MMQTDTAQTMFDLKPDDGSIARHLEELEERLNAWLRAMSEAQAELAAESQRSAAADVPPSADAAPQPDPLPAPEPPVETGPQPVSPLLAPPSSDTPPHAPPEPVSETKPDETATHFVPAAEPFETQESDEDEALLASLDEKTAMAIRVRRRLGTNKSVHELLDEIRENPPGEPDKPRRWWRLGDT